jgi:hypothetical protein
VNEKKKKKMSGWRFSNPKLNMPRYVNLRGTA